MHARVFLCEQPAGTRVVRVHTKPQDLMLKLNRSDFLAGNDVGSVVEKLAALDEIHGMTKDELRVEDEDIVKIVKGGLADIGIAGGDVGVVADGKLGEENEGFSPAGRAADGGIVYKVAVGGYGDMEDASKGFVEIG